jgi:hypothetical protein
MAEKSTENENLGKSFPDSSPIPADRSFEDDCPFSGLVSRHDLQSETIVLITNTSPERDTALILAQDINGQPYAAGPDLLFEDRERHATDARSSSIATHKELPEVDRLFFCSEQSIANRFIARKHHSPILTLQPLAHPLLELRNGHLVSVAFVANELVIPIRQ